MKQKILILILLALIYTNANAQDTVRYGDSNYFFMPLGAFIPTCCFNFEAPVPTSFNYLGNYVSEPLLVYGIAIVSLHKPRFGGVYNHNLCQMPTDTSSLNLDLYAMLLIKEGDGYYHQDSVKWYSRYPNKYFEFEQVPYFNNYIDTTVPVYEFYFNTPQIVFDTFYVGLYSTHATFDGNGDFISYSYGAASDNNTVDVTYWWDIPLCQLYTGQDALYEHVLTYGNLADEIHRDTHYYDLCGSNYYAGIFPIIVPPDTDAVECIPVQNFRRTGYVDGRPLFNWDRLGGQQTFQISYGPADHDPDSYRVVNASTPPFLLPDRELDSTVLYAARCRARCHHTCPLHDTIVWSPWSDTVQFFTGSHPAMGIGQPTADAPSFTLSPNPVRGRNGMGSNTHRQVTVTLRQDAAPPCVVTLRDEQGRKLQRHAMEGRTLTLATDWLAAGLYLVTLDTPQGSSTQKLVVE